MPRIERRFTQYDPESVGIGIVHIGLGGFHRAHQAAYVEQWLNRNRGGDWGICAANVRSNSRLVEQLREQNCGYHIAEYADSANLTVTEIHSIREVLFARDDKRELLERMTAPSTRIVSLTVTEKGYCLGPATGELLADDDNVAHDLKHPRTPRTAPGIVLEALRRRRALGLRPFTVLSCDNMPDNGTRARRAVCSLARGASAELAEWIETAVAFPSSMVDRIVPAVTEETIRRFESAAGFSDPCAVACEAFSQWVIEDQFPASRPDWDAEGVEMVADVKPFETLKLRVLNGAHSLLAYAGLLRGRTTVAEAMGDEQLIELVDAFIDEASASLDATEGIDLKAYRASVLARFKNDALEHSLHQIAMDGSQKMPQRWLDGACVNVENGRGVSATAAAVAAWMRYVRGHDDDGNRWPVDDPLAAELARCHRGTTSAAGVVDGLLSLRRVFPERLAADPGFRRAVLDAYSRLAGDNEYAQS